MTGSGPSCCPGGAGLAPSDSGESERMEQSKTPPPTPADATEATAEQRELQDQLDHQNDDPDAPAHFQSRRQVADET